MQSIYTQFGTEDKMQAMYNEAEAIKPAVNREIVSPLVFWCPSKEGFHGNIVPAIGGDHLYHIPIGNFNCVIGNTNLV